MNKAERDALILDTSVSDGAVRTAQLLGILGVRAGGMLQEELAKVRGVEVRTYRRHLKELQSHRTKMSVPYSIIERDKKSVVRGNWRRGREMEEWIKRERLLKRQWAEAGDRLFREGAVRCRGLACFRICHYASQDEPVIRVRDGELECLKVA